VRPQNNLIISVVAILCLTGCDQCLRFKVLDASSGRPLEGVKVYCQEDRHQMFERAKHYIRTNLPPTGDDGTFILKRTHLWSTSHFTLSCTNYVTCYGILDDPEHVFYSEKKSEPFLPFNSSSGDYIFKGEFFLKGPISTSTKSNGFNIIVMRPQ